MTTPTSRSVAAALLLLSASLGAWLLLAAGPAGSTAGASPASEAPAQDKRAELMKLKLDYAKNVLEGLTLEKMDLVADNARELKLLSAAAEWEPATVPGPLYLTYTREFQRLADSLATHAKDGNLDAATLCYVQLTINCVECHKYVRRTDR
ncbi:hypothetical protein [Tautonia sociabilis]|uniref:Cytochrome C n=1 Tax=Tautonia sociabilis TaxID=2080755 RepID=A0A432MH42_9BACT|nr:hypothetical protein [Tautonia sociabilis]RUL86297.1 hypothetical protein TsocGM_16330 [Tautonia sociabilis]